MSSRKEQREATRNKILDAALEAFSELGYHGASTRDIAARAGVRQSLLTYHFSNKEEIWKEAVGGHMSALRQSLLQRHLPHALSPELLRELVRDYVRHLAANPQLFRIMVDVGKEPSERLQWLVTTHLEPVFLGFVKEARAIGMFPKGVHPAHVLFMMIGASSMIFAVANTCKGMTGLDPTTPEAIETHAELVARTLVP